MYTSFDMNNFKRAYSKFSVVNFIEMINCGIFSTIQLDFWHFEI